MRSRREVVGMGLKALAAMVFAAGASPGLWGGASEACKRRKPVPDAAEFFKRNFHLPKKMAGTIFWGYKPNPEVPRDERILLRFRLAPLNFIGAMTRKDAANFKVKTVSRKECGQSFVSSSQSGLSYFEQRERIRMRRAVSVFMEKIETMSPQKQLDEKLIFLTLSFRNVMYELSTAWQSIPLTPGELLHRRKGDCKDFAFSRYLMALDMGIDPDHLQIILFDSREPGGIGHANLALFNPEISSWIMVDGIGRAYPWQDLGSVVFYENHPDVYKALAGNYHADEAVPFAGITRKGMYFFDSVKGFTEEGYPVFKDPLPIPHPGDRPVYLLVDDAHFRYPTPDGPQTPVPGQGFMR